MALQKHLLIFLIVMTMSTPAIAAPWVRGYVVSDYELAFHFGGKAGYGDPLTEPGEDCVTGTTLHVMPYQAELKTSWRPQAVVDTAINNHPVAIDDGTLSRQLPYRGFRPDVDTYLNPFAAPDLGMEEVTGKIADGFDLDNNPNSGGFTSPSGEKGIDNALYRAWGCLMSWRNEPYTAYLSERSSNQMREGQFTMVVRISGNQDPMNDNDATVEIGYSPDHIVMDASGNVATDYSYRIVESVEYTKLKAKIKNGVVETEQVSELHAPKPCWFPQGNGDIDMYKGRIRLVISADGSVSGLMGGYRDWRDLYTENTFVQSGPLQEENYHQDQIAMYYALRRVADGMPDPKTGQNMGVSAAYRFKAVPAFVINPEMPATIAAEVPDNGTGAAPREQSLYISALFKSSVMTDTIQEMPQLKRPPRQIGPKSQP